MQEEPIKDRDGDYYTGPFQPIAALRALDLVGKHVDIQAFKEVIELETGPNLASALDAARKRLEAPSKFSVEEATDADIDTEATDVPEIEDKSV
jgi:hypothetical protein